MQIFCVNLLLHFPWNSASVNCWEWSYRLWCLASIIALVPMMILVADRMAPVTRSQLDIRSRLSNSVIRCLHYRGVRMLETGDEALALAQPPSYRAMGGSSNESQAYLERVHTGGWHHIFLQAIPVIHNSVWEHMSLDVVLRRLLG